MGKLEINLIPQNYERQVVYNSLNYELLSDYVKNTFYRGRLSKNSFMFSRLSQDELKNINLDLNEYRKKVKKYKEELDREDKLQLLKEVFGLDSSNLEELYKEATHGSGNEELRINVLSSSSLCAFLHFYNVSKETSVCIDNVIYDEVHFEVQNDVIFGRDPSNIDVVLISHKNKKILFLESKFSEFLNISHEYIVSNEYIEFYKLLKLNELYDFCKINDGRNDSFKLKSKIGKHYIGGIKQLISHYIGVINFIYTNESKNEYKNGKIKCDDYEIELATIVFDGNWKFKNGKNLDDYREIYSNVVEILEKNKFDMAKLIVKNELDCAFKKRLENFKIKSSLVTYQDIFYNRIENNGKLLRNMIKIKEFYNKNS